MNSWLLLSIDKFVGVEQGVAEVDEGGEAGAASYCGLFVEKTQRGCALGLGGQASESELEGALDLFRHVVTRFAAEARGEMGCGFAGELPVEQRQSLGGNGGLWARGAGLVHR